MIDAEEVELEEWGRHPGVPVLSSSHQMLPGELRGTGWGSGSQGQATAAQKQRRDHVAQDTDPGFRSDSWL